MRINRANSWLAMLMLAAASLLSIGESQAQMTTINPATLKSPNVVLIVVDDLGWNDLSSMGSRYYETPNIDKLARYGVRFLSSYAASQSSSPSRAAILTGKAPARLGITTNIEQSNEPAIMVVESPDKLVPPESASRIGDREMTLAKVLSQSGYATQFIGKWHLGSDNTPLDFGFDTNFGGWSAGTPEGGHFSPYENPLIENNTPGETLSMRLANEAIAAMRNVRKESPRKPIFTMLSFYAVHSPLETTQDRWDYYRQKAISQGVADEGFDGEMPLPSRLNQDNPIYAGMVEQVDLAVGRVMEYLEESGYDRNTIVILTSDNGGVVSGDDYSTSLKPLRGGKGLAWEGGLRVPLLIYNPMMKSPNVIINEPVVAMDLYPTILDFAKMEQIPTQHVDGVSLLPILKGGTLSERNLCWHYPHYNEQGGVPTSVIRRGDYKLISYYEDSRKELYNLKRDLSERIDLSKEQTDRVFEMNEALEMWLDDARASFPIVDTLYSDSLSKIIYKQRFDEAKTQQERSRKEQLTPKWSPNDNWWNSK